MRTYELVVVLKPVDEKERKKALTSIKSLFGDMKVSSEKEWGSKALKYAINKELTGFYFDFELEGNLLPADLEKKLFQMDTVLRHLIIRKK
ncbi:MAG: 30S ribosomal protein S6 [Patescibacteria group bacterium]|nr:30S ribosomal protein S6 [Patescibacteria group bacterium]